MFFLARITAWISLCLFATMFAKAEKVSDLPLPTGYVNDFAGVIDADSQQKMQDLARQVYTKAHATIEVVTIKTLDGEPIEDFATALEEKWKVGAKGTDKGLLMIFVIGDRKRRIEVGYGLEGILNDAKVGDIGRSMVPQLQQGQYGPAILGGEQQIATVIAADAGVTLDEVLSQHTYHRESARHNRGSNWIGLLIFVFFLFLIFGRRGGGGGGGGSFLPWFLLGSMMNGGRSGYGGGGFSSGGFDGGGSSGGGNDGGDFGGGFGGDSGGGGASGDW